MKRVSGILLCVLLIFDTALIISQVNENVEAVIITVDDDGGADYTNIQDAIDAASSGDTVFVYPGNYTSLENITISKSIILKGSGPNETIIIPGRHVVLKNCDNVGIENLSIKDGALYYNLEIVNSSNVSVENLDLFGNWGSLLIEISQDISIQRVIMKPDDRVGISSNNTMNLLIEEVTVGDAESPILINWATNITIRNSNAFNSTEGFSVYDSTDVNLYGNELEGTGEYTLGSGGYLVKRSNNVYIFNSTVFNHTHGISIERSFNVQILNNMVFQIDSQSAIYTSGSENTLIQNNIVKFANCGIYVEGGTYEGTRNKTIWGNRIENCSLGLQLSWWEYDLVVTENTISNNHDGVQSRGDVGNLIFTDNTIINNTGIGLALYENSFNYIYTIWNSTIIGSGECDIKGNTNGIVIINSTYGSIGSAIVISKNYLDVKVKGDEDFPIEGATVIVYDNGNLSFLGITDSKGMVNNILVTDLIHYWMDIDDNETKVEVSYNHLPFYNNNRSIDMSSRRFEEFNIDITPPQVISNSPDGSDIRVDTNITVQFSKRMYTNLTQDSFSLKLIESNENITGTFKWNSNITGFVFFPSNYLEYNTTYNVSISETVKDVTDTTLDKNYCWEFTTLTMEKSDIDGDGLPDAWEFDNNLNPYNSTDAQEDIDNDGYTNFQEYQEGSDPNDPRSTVEDTDGDGLLDDWEITRFGDLSKSANDDSDSDGYTNLQEYHNNTDPNDPESHPPREAPSTNLLDYWLMILLVVFILLIIIVAVYLRKRKTPPDVK